MRRTNSMKNKCSTSNQTAVFVALLSIIMLLGTSTPYYANSAQTKWTGVDATGTIITDEDCPIVVEKEVLTFDIQEFPSNYYSDMTEYLAYSGKVTAEYTFYNPSDYTVTATLLFPYGKLPDYAEYYDQEAEEYVYDVDVDKYTVTIDGKEIESTIRHTLSNWYDQFDLVEDLPKVIDGYVNDEFYSPDTTVYCVTYTMSGINQKTATAALEWDGDAAKTKLIVENLSGGGVNDDSIQMHLWAGNDEQIKVWMIGEYVELPQWTIYKNGACEEVAEGKVEKDSKEPIKTMTFKDFIMMDYDQESGILESDWYNAKVANLNDSEWAYGVIRSDSGGGALGNSLLRWYEYEITLEPGQRIVNTVTAPMYPSIDLNYDPDIYTYTYLLSPAQTWSEFGSLDIVLNTPYYITESTVAGYEKTDDGYQWKLSGLPEGELTFTLSTDEHPKAPVTFYNGFSTMLNNIIQGSIVLVQGLAVVVIGILLIGGGIIFYSWKKRKGTKDDN